MRINGLTAYDCRSPRDGRLDLVLGCTVDEALSMDCSRVEVRTDAGDLADVYAGYAAKSASVDAMTKRVTLTLVYDADGIGAGIEALAQENLSLRKQLDDAQAQLDEQAAAIEELATLAAGGEQ